MEWTYVLPERFVQELWPMVPPVPVNGELHERYSIHSFYTLVPIDIVITEMHDPRQAN